MTEDLQKEYARLLREGDTEQATKVAQEMRGDDVQVETEDSKSDENDEVEDEEPVSEEERFAELNGVGPELADELVEEFGSYDEFAENASPEDLEPISGIGEKRAESLVEQAE